jgi:PPE-repeat protein
VDYGALPPEVNSARIVAGPGPGPLLSASVSWMYLSSALADSAAGWRTVTAGLLGAWQGPSTSSMAVSATLYTSWLERSSAMAGVTAAQAAAGASAYVQAVAATVPLPAVLANRALLAALVATNILGQNTPAIMATEAIYIEMWAQDAAAMYAYQMSSLAATSALPVLEPPPPASSPAASGLQSAAVSAASSEPAGSSQGIVAQIVAALTGNGTPGSGGIGGFVSGLTSSSSGIGVNANLWNTLASGAGVPLQAAQLLAQLGTLEAVEEADDELGADGVPGLVQPPYAAAIGGISVPSGSGIPTGSGTVGGGSQTPVSASAGGAGRLGRLSAPAGACAPYIGDTVPIPGRIPAEAVPECESGPSGRAGMPGVPGMPGLAGAGGSAQRRHREDPEYGHVSRVMPSRHPSAG